MTVRLDTRVTSIDVAGQCLAVDHPNGTTGSIPYDQLVVGTGAMPVVPRSTGSPAPEPSGLGTASTSSTRWGTFALTAFLDTCVRGRRGAPAGKAVLVAIPVAAALRGATNRTNGTQNPAARFMQDVAA